MPEQVTVESLKTEVLGSLNEIKSQWKGHYEELKASGADVGEKLTAIETKTDNALRRIEEAEALLRAPTFFKTNNVGQIKSIGELVTDNESYQQRLGKGNSRYFNGRLDVPINNLDVPDEKTAGSFFPHLLSLAIAHVPELKTTITSATVGSSTPGILTPERYPGIVKPGIPRVRVRDLIPRLPTTSNAVEWVKEDVFTNAASPQTEASDKAESALTFTIASASVRLIAHWIPATRQVLDDFVGLQAYINTRLLDGLSDEEDAQILRGDGTGQNLAGFSNQATAYSDGTYNQTGDTAIDKMLRMMTQMWAANMYPSGIILHPTNWAIMRSLKYDAGGGAGTGPYLLGGPQGTTPDMLWGLPVATTTSMTAGTAFVGAFASHVILWDRMQAQIAVSTEHSDYFIKNMVAIRAEERLALSVLRSDAIIYESSI